MLTGKHDSGRKELRVLQTHFKQVATRYNWCEVLMINDTIVTSFPTRFALDNMAMYFCHCLAVMIEQGDNIFFNLCRFLDCMS